MKRYLCGGVLLAAVLLTACGTPKTEGSQAENSESTADDMTYIKSSVTYETICAMYDDPDSYLGKNYHIVGLFYPFTDDDGNKIYSVYAEDSDGDHGIGIELDWDSYEGIDMYDTITVEGKLDKEHGTHDGGEIDYLVLRVTMLEKRSK